MAAPSTRRTLAGLIDATLAAALGEAVARLAGFDEAPGLSLLCIIGAWVFYRGVAEASGQGLGKWICRIELQHAEGAPGVGRSLLRAFTAPYDALCERRGRGRPCDRALGVELADAAWDGWREELGSLV